METTSKNGLRLLLELAHVSLPTEREAALVGGLELTRRIAEMLAQHDYGESEPAPSFRAPRSEG